MDGTIPFAPFKFLAVGFPLPAFSELKACQTPTKQGNEEIFEIANKEALFPAIFRTEKQRTRLRLLIFLNPEQRQSKRAVHQLD